MTGLSLGAMSIARVEEATVAMDPLHVFPDWTADAIAPHRSWLAPRHYDPATGTIAILTQSFLIRAPHHTILVDACGGNGKERNRPQFHRQTHPWLDRLAAAGARPEDIDIVLCTHMHVDHVGWNTRLENGRWVPTFPNARYVFARREFDHWRDLAARTGLKRTGDYMADSVLPVIEAGRAVLVETDHAIEDGVWLAPLPGHTPGAVGIHLRDGGQSAILCGDLMHHAIQCPLPDWSTHFCTDPDLARATRRAFLERHAESDMLVIPAHFPAPTAGRILRAGDAFRFQYLEE